MALKPKKYVYPKTMGGCADKLYQTKQKRLALSKELKVFEEEEKLLKAHIIDKMPVTDSGASGKLARVSVEKKEVPVVVDVAKFRTYLNRTKRFDLAQSLKPSSGVVAMWDDGKEVPGIDHFTSKVISLNKL